MNKIKYIGKFVVMGLLGIITLTGGASLVRKGCEHFVYIAYRE